MIENSQHEFRNGKSNPVKLIAFCNDMDVCVDKARAVAAVYL